MRAELRFTALGTPWNIIFDADLPDDGMRALERRIRTRLEDFERTYSRFRADSLVSHIKTGACTGTEDHYVVADADGIPYQSVMFPPDAEGLFAIADALHVASDGHIDPCVGADLETLGYDAELRFAVGGDAGGGGADETTGAAIAPSSWEHLGAAHRLTWARLRAGAGPCELRIPVDCTPPSLDFGACGKGYAVDLVAGLLETAGARNYVIDASGDLRVRSRPLRIALESPFDPSRAVGVAEITGGSFCASGVTRRHWQDATSGMELHHILDAINGRPTRGILASWTAVKTDPDTGTRTSTGTAEPITWDGAALAARYPTAVADGLATALFSCAPARLRDFLPYEFALVRSDGGAQGSAGFPGRMFLA